jgi:peptidyl-prolyl cis-trans isomerase A (cyclophilin A)
MLKILLIAGLVTGLTACGGGGSDFAPLVSAIQAQSLRYGQTATIRIGGKFLRHDMTADTPTCSNPTFAAASTPELAILNCTVTATGPLPISIKAANGDVLYSDTLTVLQPQVTLITSKGNIVMELNAALAPTTVNNFLAYVSSGYYGSTLFHRVIAGFVVQGGGYTTGLVKKAGQKAPIALESNTGLFNTRSTVAMARTPAPDSATSEFFVNLADNPSLDYKSADNPGYAVFGTVVAGMEVVDAIAAIPTATLNGTADVPLTEVTLSFALQTQ